MTTPILDGIIRGQIQSGNIRKLLQNNLNAIPENMQKIVRNIINSDVTDEQALKIYENIIKIKQNLSGEQIKTILKALEDAYKKDPEKFAQAISSGKLKEAFLTNGIITLTTVATGTWSALCLLFAFGTESLLASLQKRAGRLGVMKAIQELNDPAYYANDEIKKEENVEEKTETNSKEKDNSQTTVKQNLNPLLQKIIAERKTNALIV